MDYKAIGTAKLTNELSRMYNGLYTFDPETYSTTHKKVLGTCTKHNDAITFTPTSIYRGTIPCVLCRNKVNDTDSFIAKVKTVHHNRYTYDKAIYTSYHEKITITCKVHGDFSQRASDHLQGKGCNKCGNNIQNTEEIVGRFKEIHKTSYDYTKVVFTKMHDKVIITCPKHGDFLQKPADHIFNRQGCPSCGSSGYSALKPAYFYILKVKTDNSIYYKIGVTNKTLKSRHSSTHDKKFITKCFLYKFSKGNLAQELEQSLLKHYKNFKANKNILLSGNTEIITIDPRRNKTFKELFNDYRRKENACGS